MRFAVIMAGGRGERLWPLSTQERPKQFLRLLGERTMLQETVERVAPLVSLEHTYVVVGREHVELVSEQLPSLPAENIIVEPLGRGTASCVGLAAVRLAQIDPEGVMLVLPADHVVKDGERFLKLLEDAATIAAGGTYLVTLGVSPDRPATGYGYIQASTPWQRSGLAVKSPVLEVERFTEKPDRRTAERFLAEGDYLWNSGIFIWRVDTILREIEAHMPKLHAALLTIGERIGAPDYEALLERVYREQDVVSIDYGVMEKSDRVLVLPTGEIGWSDVGDWAALGELLEHDGQGNAIQAHHIGIDTENCVIISPRAEAEGRLVATLGLAGLVIVDTDDVLLVMDKDRAQEVKRLIELQAAEREGPPGGVSAL
ncbi:MAG: mannose-1-phosphate guanylyltransferase [Candidatus Bipolaricaulia bacterium]